MITRLEFICLYIPQGQYFIRFVWPLCTEEYVFFWFWVKVHL